jgi:hypothetical protein
VEVAAATALLATLSTLLRILSAPFCSTHGVDTLVTVVVVGIVVFDVTVAAVTVSCIVLNTLTLTVLVFCTVFTRVRVELTVVDFVEVRVAVVGLVSRATTSPVRSVVDVLQEMVRAVEDDVQEEVVFAHREQALLNASQYVLVLLATGVASDGVIRRAKRARTQAL